VAKLEQATRAWYATGSLKQQEYHGHVGNRHTSKRCMVVSGNQGVRTADHESDHKSSDGEQHADHDTSPIDPFRKWHQSTGGTESIQQETQKDDHDGEYEPPHELGEPIMIEQVAGSPHDEQRCKKRRDG